MSEQDLFSLFFLLGMLLCACLLIVSKELIRSACWLLALTLGLAMLFLWEGASFVAAVHIIVYVGGVLVLLSYGIMLSTRGTQSLLSVSSAHRSMGALVSLSLGTLLVFLWGALAPHMPTDNTPPAETGIDILGRLLMSEYVIFLELLGVFLLIVLLGTAALLGEQTEQTEQTE